ncbi:glycoside hydrolase family 2 TIM barrel-domain containing protein [Novosphingobium sp. BL-8H]|uniref:glycoside hydrolase family 2 protein n=1 Tax=Novosphingobium sp. BL-8H TaxID=3127640 RepID=UPI003756CA82
MISLDAGWMFHRGDVKDAQEPAFDDREWTAITLPHTFNGADGDDGGTYFRGAGWYRRTMTLERLVPERRVWLQFDGAAIATEVWVNGQKVGRHEGGYAGFRFDVTSVLRAGNNTIAVRTDNAPSRSITPLGGDFTVFGGLYRHVWLVEVPLAHIDMADLGGPGVYVTTRELDAKRAKIEARVLLRNDGPADDRMPLTVLVRDPSGNIVSTSRRLVRITANMAISTTISLSIDAPHMWQGRSDPYLYSVTAELGGDAVTVPLGLRSIAFDPKRGFLLNGQPYLLHGVNLFHSGRPGRGLAVSDSEVVQDMQTLDELGVTGVRFAHFQHSQTAYDEADRRGFAIWTELGLNGVSDPGQKFLQNAAMQLRELIRQNYNHPSVILWGLGNEVYATTPDVPRLLGALQAVAHEEDHSRPTVYAHCCQADDDKKAMVTDVIGFNRYFGWYPGQEGTIGSWAQRYHAQHPSRAFAVSEYGAGGSILHQQLVPPEDNAPASGWHPEQAQTRYHIENWRELKDLSYVWGKFVWVAFDLASDGRHEGDRPGINDKGLVTYDRSVRKDAFYWYQANWSSVPMIHLADRRLARRSEAQTLVRAFTNDSEATLSVNGRSLGRAEVTDHIVQWRSVPLQMGDNLIVVETPGARDEMHLVRIVPSALGASEIPQNVMPQTSSIPTNKPPGQ